VVSGRGAPRRFARTNLIQTRRAGKKPLVPSANYLKLWRSYQQCRNLAGLTELDTLRKDVELSDVTEDLVETAVDFFHKYTELKPDGTAKWDLLDCLAAATALDKQAPLAVMNEAPYRKIPTLTDFEAWWR
jgi:hypothetical protein